MKGIRVAGVFFVLLMASILVTVSGCVAYAEELQVDIGLGNDEYGDSLYINQYMPGETITVYTESDGYVYAWMDTYGSYTVYRMMISGTAEDGERFERHLGSYNDSNSAYWNVANQNGTYGPYELKVTAGSQEWIYSVLFVVEDVQEENYSGFAQVGYVDTKEFVPIGKNELVSINWPKDGAVLYGQPGYNLGVEVELFGVSQPITYEVIEMETGRVIATDTVDYYTYYASEGGYTSSDWNNIIGTSGMRISIR